MTVTFYRLNAAAGTFRPDAVPPLQAAARPAGTPPRRPPHSPIAWLATAAYGVAEMPQVQQHVEPHEHARHAARVAPKNTTNRGSDARHDELRADDAGQEPDDRLGQAADADDAARQRILDQPGQRSRQQPGRRARRQRHVDHHDQHQVDGDRAPHEKRAQRWSAAPAPPRRPEARRPPSLGRALDPLRAPASGVSTTSTSSSAEKSTAGWIVMRLYDAAGLLDGFDLPDDEPLRDRCRRCRTSRRCRRVDVGHLRHVLQPQPVVAAADDDALRARALDDRAGRRVAVDQQLHLRRAQRSARPRARPRRPARSPPCRCGARRACPCRSSASGNRASRPRR